VSIPATGDLVAVYRLPTYTLQATPEAPHGVSFRTEENGPGTAQFSIPLDDTAYPDIAINDVAAIRRDGDTVASMLIEMIHEHTLDAQGGARQVATYSGRLVGAFLEWAVIAPALGDQSKPIEEDAVFDWRSPRYDPADDSWAASTEIMTVAAAKAGGWPTQPMGQDFTDSTNAQMIWDSSGTDSDADEGTCLFYRDITITTGGRHGLEVLMDNDGYVWVDGIQVLEINQNDGYHRVSFKRLELTAGVHRFCFQVRNIDVDNPAALAYNLFKTDQQDRPMPGVAVIATSSASTQVLSYPDPFPGMTVGEILLDLIDEAQTRGVFPWCAPSFSETVDSDGATWDREVGITTKTGTTTLLQFLDELVAQGRISQWRWSADGETFDVFAPGYSNRPTGTGYPTGVELEPAPVDDPRSGQVIELDRRIT
jgi:hypothetical protein